MNIKISVIIPVYNMQEYVKECLSSIINQSLKSIEIICVDDCSNDNSSSIIQEFTIEDKRVKHIKLEQNSGSAIARNRGIDEANGEFIIFMDPDDYYYDSTVLERLYLAAKNKNVKIIAGNILKYDISTNTAEALREETYLSKNKFYSFKSEYFATFDYQRFMFKREFLIDNNLYFPDYLRRQDPVFFLKTMLLNDIFYGINYFIYVYRFSHQRITWNSRRKKDYIKSCKDNLYICKDNNLPNHYYWEFLDFKNSVLLENLFKIDKDISIDVENIKNSISYELLKEGAKSKVKDNEKHFINNILQKIKNYKNKEIIIYGFGNIGIMLYEELKNKYNICKIVDKNLFNINVDNHKISSEIKKTNIDGIVILTVLNNKIKSEVLKEIELLGFTQEQVLLG